MKCVTFYTLLTFYTCFCRVSDCGKKRLPKNIREGFRSLYSSIPLIQKSLFRDSQKKNSLLLTTLPDTLNINVFIGYNESWASIYAVFWFGDEFYLYNYSGSGIKKVKFENLTLDQKLIVRSFSDWDNQLFKRQKYDESLRAKGNDNNWYYFASRLRPGKVENINSIAFIINRF